MARPHLYRTEAIVLKSTPLGEADLIVTLFSKELGNLTAVAKGVRRTTSKMVGHLEPLTRVELALARGQNLDVITQAQVLDSFGSLKANLDAISKGIYMAELVNGFGTEGMANPELYSLFLKMLYGLLEPAGRTEIAQRYFELQLLTCSGFRPELYRCVECRRELSPGQHRFSPDRGGTLCLECTPPRVHIRPLSLQALKVLRYLDKASVEGTYKLSVPQTLGDELKTHLFASIKYWLDKEVRSRAFVEHLQKIGR